MNKKHIALTTKSGLEYVSSFSAMGNTFVWATDTKEAAIDFDPIFANAVLAYLLALNQGHELEIVPA